MRLVNSALCPQLSSAYFHNCLEYSVTTESKASQVTNGLQLQK